MSTLMLAACEMNDLSIQNEKSADPKPNKKVTSSDGPPDKKQDQQKK